MKTLSIITTALLLCTAATASAQKAAFSFANGMLSDLSGNSHDAVAVGTVVVAADRFNNPQCAYSFPGTTTDYLFIPYHTDFDIPSSGAFTISLWYKGGSANENDVELLFGKGSGLKTKPEDYYLALYDWNRPHIAAPNGIAPNTDPPYTHSLNEWNHLVAIYDNGHLKLFINTIMYDSKDQTTALNQSTSGIMIGRYFAGAIDDVIFYDRALSPAEALQLYDQGSFSCQTMPITDVEEPTGSAKVFRIGIDPGNTALTVESEMAPGANYPYQVVDIAGKMLHSGYIHSESTVIPISDFPAGAYLLMIGEDRQRIFKFVKQ